MEPLRIFLLIMLIPLCLIAAVVTLLFLYALVIIISSLFINTKQDYKTDSKYFRFLLNSSTGIATRLIRIKLKISGMEKMPEGRFLLVSNHRSKFDPILSWYVFRKYRLSFISKPENFKVPVYGRIIHRCCFMPIDRENPRKATKTVKRAAELIVSDTASVAVYPEGTRNTGTELLPFHNAMFKIAQKANVPIVVVTVRDADLIRKNYPLHRSHVAIDVLEVLSAERIKGMKTNEIGDLVAEIMTENLSSEVR